MKKIGLPKTIIQKAIAKGQGLSESGKPLENITFEAILPLSVSTIIECQTDNKLRTLQDIRRTIKEVGGTITPTIHMFERQGRIVLGSDKEIVEENVMEMILDAGALDMEIQGESTVNVYTDPVETASVARSLSESSGMEIKGYEIIWRANPATQVDVGSTVEGSITLGNIIGTYRVPIDGLFLISP